MADALDLEEYSGDFYTESKWVLFDKDGKECDVDDILNIFQYYGAEASVKYFADKEKYEADRQAEKEREARIKQRRAELPAIRKLFNDTGEYLPGEHILQGETLYIDNSSIAYGGGSWFVIGSDYIWFVQGNGADGDDWSRNNVRTGGAGAIGIRLLYSDELKNRIQTALNPE